MKLQLSFLTSEAWTSARRNLTMTMSLIIVVAVSAALLGAGLLVRAQVNNMKGFWYDKVEMSVFLCAATSPPEVCPAGVATPEQRTAVETALSTVPAVEEVYFETSTEAYERFQEQFAGSNIADTATPDDLGESFRIKLVDPADHPQVTAAVATLPGVETVDDQRDTLETLFAILDGLRTAAVGIALTMLVATTLLVSNAMRLTAHTRRKETTVMRLVGAPKQYIRLPFIIETGLTAVAGATIGVLILAAVKATVIDNMLATAFRFTPFIGWDTLAVTAFIVTGVVVMLTSMSAAVAVRRHLNV